MAIFKVQMRDGSAGTIVRANCITCARKMVVEQSPADEFDGWCNASVELIRNPEYQGYAPEGPQQIIKRLRYGE